MKLLLIALCATGCALAAEPVKNDPGANLVSPDGHTAPSNVATSKEVEALKKTVEQLQAQLKDVRVQLEMQSKSAQFWYSESYNCKMAPPAPIAAAPAK